jgi:NAD-dependent SIR2 family protein deacetylase
MSCMGTQPKERLLLMSAITCHGQSWLNDCQVCEQQAYDDYIREMHDDYESKYVDQGDMEDYDDDE